MNRWIAIAGTGFVVLFVGVLLLRHFQSSQAAALSTAVSAPRQPEATINTNTLSSAMNQLISKNAQLDMSISIIDIQTGQRYHYGDGDAFGAASVAKLLTATLYLQHVEQGTLQLDQKVGALSAKEQIEKLIVESDNTAWDKLNTILTHEGLETYAKAIGLQSYNAEQNTMTSDDVALLLQKLASKKLLTHDNTTLLLGYMQRATMRDFIIAGTPSGATTYHKTGYLSDRLHDVAIISKGDRSFVLAIFSKTTGSYNFGKGAALFKEITAKASESFF